MKTFEITYRHETTKQLRLVCVKAEDMHRALIAGDRHMAADGYGGEWNPCNVVELL